MQQETLMCQEPCTRVQVLEATVRGLERENEHREERLLAVEKKVGDLVRAMDDLKLAVERRLSEVQASSWRQFWALAAVVLGASVGIAVYLSQMLLQHMATK